MYYSGQIIHDIDNAEPFKVGSADSAWAWDGYPKGRHTHYVYTNELSKIFVTTDLEKAKILYKAGEITPCLNINTLDHCWDCRNWLSNPPTSYCRSNLHRKDV